MFRPGAVLVAWLRPGLEMRPSPISGRGLFAREPVAPGQAVARWGGVVFNGAQVRAGLADLGTIAVLDEDLYLADPAGTPPAEDYNLNHSCDPNLWMGDAVTLVARRAILPGEELTADYGLWLYGVDWTLDPCLCGAPLCRGRVTAHDWRLPWLQKRYAGHFTPYLNRRIAAAGLRG